MSEGLDRELRWDERWALRMHVLVCHSCREVYRQIVQLTDALRRRQTATESGGDTQAELSAEARERMMGEIRRRLPQ